MRRVRTLLRSIAIAPIRFYQRVISPLLGPSCRYAPTCSQYAVEAIRTHGVIKGWLLSVWRILRCNPWTRGGVDHVPAPGRWTSDPWTPPADWPGWSDSPAQPMGWNHSPDFLFPDEDTRTSLVELPGSDASVPTDLPAAAGRPPKTMSSTNVRSHECSK